MPVTFRLRPRLHLQVPGKAADLAERIRSGAGVYSVTVADTYLVIKNPEDQQHYWSPQLQVTLEDQDGTVAVHGLFTPMPAVWTLFACSYLFILVMGFFGTIFGLAQWQLEQTPTFLWTVPICLVLLAGVYIAAMIGQGLGHKQTEELTVFLQQILGIEP